MGNYLLLVALAAVVSIASLLHGARQSSLRTDKQLAQYTFKSVVAREAALSGLNLTLLKIAADTTAWSEDPSAYELDDIPYRRATFSTRVSSNHLPGPIFDRCRADTIDVVATAIPDADSTGLASHRIEGTYVRTCRMSPDADGNADAIDITPDFDTPDWILGGLDPVDTPDDSTASGPDSLLVPKGLGLVAYAEW